MQGRHGKVWPGLSLMEKITGAFEGLVAQVRRFNDNLEELTSEIKRFTDLGEKSLEPRTRVKSKEQVRKAVGKPVSEKPRGTVAPLMTIPETLFKSILDISKKKPEFTMSEVVDRSMRTTRGSFKKQSLRTALQGFKVGSKTAHKQPERCRNLLVEVEGKRGLHKLNPEKTLP